MAPVSSRHAALSLLGVGAALGVAVWMFSPWLTGASEPWDAAFPLWPLSWLTVAIGGALTGRALGVMLPAGYALGQMGATLRAAFSSEFGLLGWLFIVGYAVAAMLGTLLIVAGTAQVRRLRRSRGES
jgi:hypothetical protein